MTESQRDGERREAGAAPGRRPSPWMIPLKVAAWLLALIAALTLMRSVMWVRVPTIAASGALLLAAVGILRARTWGVALALLGSAAFGTAAALGMGPAWFWIVAAAGALPTLLMAGPLLRFDRVAAAGLIGLALASGVLGAFALQQLLVAFGAP